MTELTMKPSDHVYYGINSLRGWDEALGTAHGWGGNRARNVGRLLSGIIVAGGEDRTPVAMAGQLDDNGTGNLAVLYADVIVIATAATILSDDGTTAISVHPLSAVGSLGVKALHNYYDGTKSYERHNQLEVIVTVEGTEFTFTRRGYNSSELTDDNAVKKALDTLRAHLAQ
ncbi:hypothetical protein [Microbacterium sp. RURRCA19A]|uniref:hypothetical protein n=1 Tax=Microbacterium sp. RURRCA19A TaxID=1907391 RepID=UPI001115874A|nr:hypothetical protein [Microbacterium sp. RURRCA19A]